MDEMHRHFARGQYGADLGQIEPSKVYEVEKIILKRLGQGGARYPALVKEVQCQATCKCWSARTPIEPHVRMALYRLIDTFGVSGPDPYDVRNRYPSLWEFRLCTFGSPAGYGEGGYRSLWRE